MDRNTITGFLLIFAMVIVYQLYFVPAPEVLPEGQSQAVSTPETPSPVSRFPESSIDGIVDSTYVSRTATLRSDVLEVVLTTDGGAAAGHTEGRLFGLLEPGPHRTLDRRRLRHELHRPR